jgi:hypothetical protein
MRRNLTQHERNYAPRGMRVQAAADWVGFGTTKFLEMIADGRMPAGKLVDGCRVWDRYQLDEAFEALPDEADETSQTGTSGWGRVA